MRLPLPALLVALVLTLALAVRSLDARMAPQRRPVILVVHGRGYLTRDSAEFRRQALHALRQGAFATTKDSLLADDDVRIVWYADLLDVKRKLTQSCGPSDPAPNILQAFALIASELIDANATDSASDDVRGVAGDLRFFGDATTRCAAERRIGEAIARANSEGRPVVLVGHSLGAMVAWGHLQHRAVEDDTHLAEVSRFVTVGSPLGSRGLRELLLGDSTELSLPRSVRSWVNVVNAADPFAAKLTGLDSATGRVRSLKGVADVSIDREDEDPHEIRGYLRAPAAANAVLGGWCEGFARRERPGACEAIHAP